MKYGFTLHLFACIGLLMNFNAKLLFPSAFRFRTMISHASWLPARCGKEYLQDATSSLLLLFSLHGSHDQNFDLLRLVDAEIEVIVIEVILSKKGQSSAAGAAFSYALRFTVESCALEHSPCLQTLALAEDAGWRNCEAQFAADGISVAYCGVDLPKPPVEEYQVTIRMVEFVVAGPWEITWALP